MGKVVRGDDPPATDAGHRDGDPRSPGDRSETMPPPPPSPIMQDGASARRTAHSVSSLHTPPPRLDAAAASGPGLDATHAEGLPTMAPRGLLRDLRRLSGHLAGKTAGWGPPAGRRVALLDRIGRVLAPGAIRIWLSELMMRNRSEIVDDFGLDPLCVERYRPLFEFLYRSYWRVESSGMEHVPDRGRALMVSNHSGTLPYDGAMIMYAVRHDHPAHRVVRPLVEDFVFHFPFLGVLLNRMGCVRACQENAEQLLSQDRIAVVFPEGVKGISKLYEQRYQLQRFGRGGFIKLAIKTRSPIIPTAVVGAEEIHPMLTQVTWLASYLGIPYVPVTPTFPWLGPLGLVPLPTKWWIRFGEPIDLAAQYGPNAHEDRILVARLTERVRSTIQGLVDECLARRRSIFFG